MAEHSQQKPSGLPEIKDDAADTPMWVPMIGVGLLVAFVLLFTYKAVTSSPAGEPAEDGATPAAAAPAE
jgi:hypothetical protein